MQQYVQDGLLTALEKKEEAKKGIEWWIYLTLLVY